MYLRGVIYNYRTLILAFVIFICNPLEIFGQGGTYTYRQVAVLDLTERNSEIDSSRTRSARHIMQVSGVPFVETTDFTFALQHKILFIAPRIKSTTFTNEEELALHEYVYNGGTVIASNCYAPDLYDLFGIVDYAVDDSTKRFIWNINSELNYFDRINDDKEITVSLGDTSVSNTIFDHKYYFPAAGAVPDTKLRWTRQRQPCSSRSGPGMSGERNNKGSVTMIYMAFLGPEE